MTGAKLITLIACAILICLSSSACSSQPSSAETVDMTIAGGLGEKPETVEKKLEAKKKTPGIFVALKDGYGNIATQDKKLLILFSDNRASDVTLKLANDNISPKDALALALTYAPTDAKYLKEYKTDDTTTIYVYQSKKLGSVFPKEDFTNAKGEFVAGTFAIAIIDLPNGTVSSAMLYLGDHP